MGTLYLPGTLSGLGTEMEADDHMISRPLFLFRVAGGLPDE